ncbi:helix-turn-helix domain-containing protein [Enterococcus cecorum]|uniref:helix-turn-helix domain-containing protein n=1 Tax=Enterococcus cecorum TaxID=44008 RepID=UPI003F1F6639
MASLGENIKFHRKRNNLTQKDLANLLGIAPTAISAWEVGRNKPLMDNIEQMASIFNVKKSELLGDTFSELSQPEILIIYNQLNDKRKEITLNFTKEQLKQQQEEANIVQGDFSINEDSNIYKLEQHKIKHEWRGPVSAGTGEFLFEEQSEYVEIDENEVPDRSDFCLTVNGNSMEPIFKDGSYIFVEEKEEIPSGTIGVVIVDGEAFVKRVWFEGTQARLESFNKAYKDIIVTRNDSFKIIGKVVM